MRARIRDLRSLFGVALFFLGPLLVSSCGMPRDPEGTLDRVRHGTLRVGAVDSPPFLVRSGGVATGPEAEIVQALAQRLDAAIEWRWGALDEHMAALEAFELDLVVAGLTNKSPWASRVGFTRPWSTDEDVARVVAVPPGENAMLVVVERLVESRRTARP